MSFVLGRRTRKSDGLAASEVRRQQDPASVKAVCCRGRGVMNRQVAAGARDQIGEGRPGGRIGIQHLGIIDRVVELFLGWECERFALELDDRLVHRMNNIADQAGGRISRQVSCGQADVVCSGG